MNVILITRDDLVLDINPAEAIDRDAPHGFKPELIRACKNLPMTSNDGTFRPIEHRVYRLEQVSRTYRGEVYEVVYMEQKTS